MPRSKKPAGTTADKRNGQQADLVPVDRDAPPPVPEAVQRAAARRLWEAYWNDVVSGLVQESEMALVERWVRNVERYQVLMDVADAEPLVEGSMGQLRENPAYAIAMKLEASIRADEAQLGYGPKNRAALGIAVVQQKASMAELNEKYGGAGASEDEDEDPRLQIVE